MNFKTVVIIFYLLINIFSYIIYYIDKRKAKKHRWRISEKMLLLVAYLGGGMGSLLAMCCFKHKTRHKKFTIGVPISIIMHICFWIAYFYFVA